MDNLSITCLILTGVVSVLAQAEDWDLQKDALDEMIEKRGLRKDFQDFQFTSIRVDRDDHEDKQSVNSDFLARHRRSTEADDQPDRPVYVSFTAFHETFSFTLRHSKRLFTSQVPVFLRDRDVKSRWSGEPLDCLMSGDTSRNGIVSLTYCKQIRGTILEGEYEYRIEPIDAMHGHLDETVLIARVNASTRDSKADSDQTAVEVVKNAIPHPPDPGRSRRAVTSFTIEVGICVDEVTYQQLEDAGHTTTADKILQVLQAWNGIQKSFSNSDDLGYDITITIKFIELWQTNPAGFVYSSTNMQDMLHQFTDYLTTTTNTYLPVDVIHLHSGTRDANAAGYGKQPGACSSIGQNIAVYKGDFSFKIAAHELGHNLGLSHDDNNGCASTCYYMCSYPSPFLWSSCSKTQLDTFIKGSSSACLFEENVPVSQVDPAVAAIQLSKVPTGMDITPDQNCEQMHGTGWRHIGWWKPRDYCGEHSCVDLNAASATYGKMERHGSLLYGTYCGPQMVCYSGACKTWDDQRIMASKVTVVQGNWGNWGAFSACTRTCGMGITYRERKCNDPIPKGAPLCEGSTIDAKTCNPEPCVGDATIMNDLLKQRAAESCKALIAGGVLDGTKYKEEGNYKSSKTLWGWCEATCYAQTGHSFPKSERHGLQPDGTPCTILQPTISEEFNLLRKRGVYDGCVKGICRTFGCDNVAAATGFSPQIYDGCGVCGGDNSTCVVAEGIYMEALPKDATTELAVLPTGTKLIQFYRKWSQNNNYFELYHSNGTALISWAVNFDSNTMTSPPTFGGTQWYYKKDTEFIYASGPLTEELVMKVHVYAAGSDNTGIDFGYSLPLGSTVSIPVTQSTASVTTTVTAGVGGGVTTAGIVTTAAQTTVTSNSCPSGEIQCLNGTCIGYTSICDGIRNCGDGSDESEFMCSAGTSLIIELLHPVFLMICATILL